MALRRSSRQRRATDRGTPTASLTVQPSFESSAITSPQPGINIANDISQARGPSSVRPASPENTVIATDPLLRARSVTPERGRPNLTRSLRVQTSTEPGPITESPPRPSAVTPEAESGSNSPTFVPSPFTRDKFIRGRLSRVVDRKVDLPDSFFNKWLTTDNFIRLIETFGGPYISYKDGKSTAVDLATNIMKDLRKVGLVAMLTGGKSEDERVFRDVEKRVYVFQQRIETRKNFFYIPRRNNATESAVILPTLDECKILLSQGKLDFTDGRHDQLKDWWQSSNAVKLFAPTTEEGDAYCAVLKTIDVLDEALKMKGEILSLVQGYERKDAHAQFGKKELLIFRSDIEERCTYIRAALIEAAEVDGAGQVLNLG